MRWKWKQKLAGVMAFCMLLSGALPAGSRTVYASSAEDALMVEEVEAAETDAVDAKSEIEVDDAVTVGETESTLEESTEAETEAETETESVAASASDSLSEVEKGDSAEESEAEAVGLTSAEVAISDDGDSEEISLESVEVITSPITTFYYGLDDGYIYMRNGEFLFTFSDGSSIECTPWDETWYEIWNGYGLNYTLSADGAGIDVDDAGYQPVGEYEFVIYAADGTEYLTIPYSVLSPDAISLEMSVDDTLSGLSGDGSDYYGFLAEGHYVKLAVEEGVTYNLSATSVGNFRLWDDTYTDITAVNYLSFTADYTGTYYLKVSCFSDFDLSMTSIPTVTGVEVTKNPRTTYYYKLDEGFYVPHHAEFLLTFEDGSSTECTYYDDICSEYNISYVSLTGEGDIITYDDEGYQPEGNYQYVIYVSGTEYAAIPYTVLSVDEISLELEAGETLTGLSGDGDDYGWYSEGNYLKLQAEEGKVYTLTSTVYGFFELWDENYDFTDSVFNTSFSFTADYTGIYYVKVSCSDDFDLTFTEYLSVIGIEVVTAPLSVLYYGLDYYYFAVGNTELKLYLEDGSSVNCTLYDDTWYLYGISYTMLTADGNDWSYDSSGCLPIGEYKHVYSVGDYTATSTFSVVSAEEAPELENGVETVWDNTMPTAYKLTVEEDSTYTVSITAENDMYLRIYTTDLTQVSSVYSITSEWSVELGEGTYYIHLFSLSFPNSATFSVTRMSGLVDMTYDGDPITFTYGSWGYSVGTTVSGNNCDFESGEQIVGTQTSVSGNGIIYEGFYFDGLTLNLELTDGSILEAIYDSATWWLYDIIQEFFTADGDAVYADGNGYVPVGDYLVKFSSGDVSVSIPFAVTKDVSKVSQPEIVSVYSTVQTSAKITWTEVDGADGYQIYRSTAEDGIYTCIKTITDGSTVSYTNSGLTVGKTYYYKVRAYALDSSNSRVYSDFSEVRYMPAAVVFDSVYSNSISRIRILWNEVSGADGYQIWRADSEDGTYTIVKTITDGTTTSYSNTGLESGHTYYYKMRAYTTVDDSKVFGTFSDVKVVPVMPETVTLENVYSNSTSCVRILWNEVDGAAGYQIWRADSEDGTYSIIKTITSGSTTSYNNTDVSSGQTYFYKMRAYAESDGSKVFGAYSEVVAVSVMPDTPTLTTASYTSGIAKLSWDEIDGAAGYQIWRADSANGTYTLVKSITDGSTTSYSNSGLTSGNTYYYKVRAYSEADGNKTFGEYSEVKSISVK